MAKKPTVRELRQHLGAKPPAELIDEIVALYKQFDAVREHYTLLLHGTYSQELLERYKAIITREFFQGMRPGPGRIAIARGAVQNYKKLASSPESIAEIMIHYVEMGVAYTRSYGDISAPFYASMQSMYVAAIRHLEEHHLMEQFQERCLQIMQRTAGIGWGFNDTMVEIYYTYFELEEDEEEEGPPPAEG